MPLKSLEERAGVYVNIGALSLTQRTIHGIYILGFQMNNNNKQDKKRNDKNGGKKTENENKNKNEKIYTMARIEFDIFVMH